MFSFVFSNGAASIVREDGVAVIVQPFNPTADGPQPWADEQEARDWMEIHNHAFFQSYTVALPESEEAQGAE